MGRVNYAATREASSVDVHPPALLAVLPLHCFHQYGHPEEEKKQRRTHHVQPFDEVSASAHESTEGLSAPNLGSVSSWCGATRSAPWHVTAMESYRRDFLAVAIRVVVMVAIVNGRGHGLV